MVAKSCEMGSQAYTQQMLKDAPGAGCFLKAAYLRVGTDTTSLHACLQQAPQLPTVVGTFCNAYTYLQLGSSTCQQLETVGSRSSRNK